MDNKPLLWVLGGGAFAFTAVVGYWILAITLANQLKSDQISPESTAEFIHAVIEANRNNYTDNVVVKLGRDGIEAHEHWRDERGVPLPAQFLLESSRLVCVPASLAKGLEFDAVIVAEPSRIVAAEPRGLHRLYVVLTRAVSTLHIVHAEPLPAALRG